MGRGNVCVFGESEGLFYVDNDNLDYYHKKGVSYRECERNGEDYSIPLRDIPYEDISDYEYDETESMICFDEFKFELAEFIKKRHKSFRDCDRWIDRERHAILENKLFYICLCDNEWSTAVMLIQKEPEYGDGGLEGLQKRHYEGYLETIKEALFEQFDEIGTYGGAWTSGTLKKSA